MVLSIVLSEPASDRLLNDAHSGARRFLGAVVPNWLVADIMPDDFILPAAVAQFRSFGGEWVATDFDHDCDLLFVAWTG